MTRFAREVDVGDVVLVPLRRPRWLRVIDVFVEAGLIRFEFGGGVVWRAPVWQRVRSIA